MRSERNLPSKTLPVASRFILRFFIPAALILTAALTPFYLFFIEKISFYTFHSLSGLMALKHHAAMAFLRGEYPLWNVLLFNGLPVHSGIGVADPLLITYLFFSGVKALLASSALALFIAGISMYAYLSKHWGMTPLGALLGAVLFLGNPFFGAVCHELPFMAPPVWVPLILSLYERAREKNSFFLALLCGGVISLTFFSGNLESFYFILLFFVSIQSLRLAFDCIAGGSLRYAAKELPLLIFSAGAPFFFAAVDLAPSIEIIFDSSRSKDSRISHNLFFFLAVNAGILVCLLAGKAMKFWPESARQRFKVFSCAGLMALFVISFERDKFMVTAADNLFWPALKPLMISGTDAFHWLLAHAQIRADLLRFFQPPRYIFYIQPPAYLFSLTTLLLFISSFRMKAPLQIRLFAFFAVGLTLFPYSALPNPFSHLLRLTDLNYNRLMFIFFFAQSVICAWAFDRMLHGRKDGSPAAQLHFWLLRLPAAGGALIIAGVLLIMIYLPFDPDRVTTHLAQFREAAQAHNPVAASFTGLKLQIEILSGLFMQAPLLRQFMLVKAAAALSFMLFVFTRRTAAARLCVFLVCLETLAGWSLYTFQTPEIQNLLNPHPEGRWLEKNAADSRIGTRYDTQRDVLNFYDYPQIIDLSSNYPVFWNRMTVEESAINLLPTLGKAFWYSQPGNKSYTPTYLEVFPSNVYNLMGMKYLFSDKSMPIDSYRYVDRGSRYFIYENLHAVPRFYFPRKVEQASQAAIAEKIAGAPWDAREVSYIESPVPAIYSDGLWGGEPQIWKVLPSPENELRFSYSSPTPAFLATTEAFHRHWTAAIDRIPAQIVRTNFYFRGLFIPGGEHTIRLVFEPLSFRIGLWTSLASCGILLLLFIRNFLSVFRKRRAL